MIWAYAKRNQFLKNQHVIFSFKKKKMFSGWKKKKALDLVNIYIYLKLFKEKQNFNLFLISNKKKTSKNKIHFNDLKLRQINNKEINKENK